MSVIQKRLTIIIALIAIGWFVWLLTRPQKTNLTDKLSAGTSVLTTLEASPELALVELFEDSHQPLDAVRTYQNYLSGHFTPSYTDLGHMVPDTTPEQKPKTSNTVAAPTPICIPCSQLVDRTIELSPVDARSSTVLAVDTDGVGLILLPDGPENAAKKVQRAQFKIVLGLAGPTDCVSFWHAETDAFIVTDGDRVVLAPARLVQLNPKARQGATFQLVSADGFTVGLRTASNGVLGFLEVNKRMNILPTTYKSDTGIQRFELRDPEDSSNVLTTQRSRVHTSSSPCKPSANNKGYQVIEGFYSDNNNDDSSREIRDKRWVTYQMEEKNLDADELDESFVDTPTTTTRPVTMAMDPAVDNALNDVFQPNTGKVFNDMMAMESKDREYQLDNNVFQKLEKAKMDPGIKTLLDYNEARYKIYTGENMNYEDKIQNQTNRNTKQLDKMISDLDKYKIQKLAQEYYYLKTIRDQAKGQTLPKVKQAMA